MALYVLNHKRGHLRDLENSFKVTLAVIAVAVVLLFRSNGLASIHMYVATVLGIGFTIMLTAALMGLVFLSSGTGHDESIIDPFDEDRNSL